MANHNLKIQCKNEPRVEFKMNCYLLQFVAVLSWLAQLAVQLAVQQGAWSTRENTLC